MAYYLVSVTMEGRNLADVEGYICKAYDRVKRHCIFDIYDSPEFKKLYDYVKVKFKFIKRIRVEIE